jgi:hypothetical protein
MRDRRISALQSSMAQPSSAAAVPSRTTTSNTKSSSYLPAMHTGEDKIVQINGYGDATAVFTSYLQYEDRICL